MVSSYKDVEMQFNENAGQYDRQRKKLIPCFDDFYATAISLAETNAPEPGVLDIGAGTGLLASLILEKFPQAKITLIDLSEKMLDVARERFGANPNLTYIVQDYTKYEFREPFDLIVSSLSIHHLTDEEKRQLYRKAFSGLKKDGVFINADQVLGGTPFLESLYKRDWYGKVENSGLTAGELQAAYERTKVDKMAALDDQIAWLKESGFKDVDCIYKYFNFVVLYGRK